MCQQLRRSLDSDRFVFALDTSKKKSTVVDWVNENLRRSEEIDHLESMKLLGRHLPAGHFSGIVQSYSTRETRFHARFSRLTNRQCPLEIRIIENDSLSSTLTTVITLSERNDQNLTLVSSTSTAQDKSTSSSVPQTHCHFCITESNWCHRACAKSVRFRVLLESDRRPFLQRNDDKLPDDKISMTATLYRSQ